MLLWESGLGLSFPLLSTHVHYSHKGYSLYNVGFSAGIIATVVMSLFKSFGIQTESRSIWATGYNDLFLVLLLIFFSGLILIPFFLSDHVIERYRHILSTYGIGGTDYVKSEGMAPVLVNMGINGLFAMSFVILVGGELNGPTLGGIFTIVGFSATGKHLRNIMPIMFGVLLASFLKKWNITDPGPMLALLFSTTLAPIAGEFGIFAVIIEDVFTFFPCLNEEGGTRG